MDDYNTHKGRHYIYLGGSLSVSPLKQLHFIEGARKARAGGILVELRFVRAPLTHRSSVRAFVRSWYLVPSCAYTIGMDLTFSSRHSQSSEMRIPSNKLEEEHSSKVIIWEWWLQTPKRNTRPSCWTRQNRLLLLLLSRGDKVSPGYFGCWKARLRHNPY